MDVFHIRYYTYKGVVSLLYVVLLTDHKSFTHIFVLGYAKSEEVGHV